MNKQIKTLMVCALLFSAGISLSACGSNSPAPDISQTPTTQSGPIDPSQASNYLGQYETVRFTVGYTFTDSAGTEFLDQYQNYTSGFVVTIFSSDLGNFNVDPASTYLGQTIDVSGVVTTYNGYVEILNPTNISVVN